MKIIQLKPIRETEEEYDKLEAEITRIFRQHLYLPLIAEMGAKKKTLTNSADDLLEAVESGRITFYRGHFKGAFNATISKDSRN